MFPKRDIIYLSYRSIRHRDVLCQNQYQAKPANIFQNALTKWENNADEFRQHIELRDEIIKTMYLNTLSINPSKHLILLGNVQEAAF